MPNDFNTPINNDKNKIPSNEEVQAAFEFMRSQRGMTREQIDLDGIYRAQEIIRRHNRANPKSGKQTATSKKSKELDPRVVANESKSDSNNLEPARFVKKFENIPVYKPTLASVMKIIKDPTCKQFYEMVDNTLQRTPLYNAIDQFREEIENDRLTDPDMSARKAAIVGFFAKKDTPHYSIPTIDKNRKPQSQR